MKIAYEKQPQLRLRYLAIVCFLVYLSCAIATVVAWLISEPTYISNLFAPSAKMPWYTTISHLYVAAATLLHLFVAFVSNSVLLFSVACIQTITSILCLVFDIQKKTQETSHQVNCIAASLSILFFVAIFLGTEYKQDIKKYIPFLITMSAIIIAGITLGVTSKHYAAAWLEIGFLLTTFIADAFMAVWLKNKLSAQQWVIQILP